MSIHTGRTTVIDSVNSVTMAIPSKVTYISKVITIKIPTRFFIELEKESQIPYGCTKSSK